jgi:sugar phosphate isomerase/epimerase
MGTRRSFIRTSGIFFAGLLAPRYFWESNKNFGLQLYSVRDGMSKDPAGTLAKVAKIGYSLVEGRHNGPHIGFYNYKSSEFSKILKDNGLSMPSSHFFLDRPNGKPMSDVALDNWKRAIGDAVNTGVKFMVCPGLFPGDADKNDHYQSISETLNQAGEQCKGADIQLCYHTQGFEYFQHEGTPAFQTLLTQTDKSLVKMEIDTYSLAKTGHNPIGLFKQYPDRFPTWNIKDIGEDKKAAVSLGNGIIDFEAMFRDASIAGLKYFFVRQDGVAGDELANTTRSLNYVQKEIVGNQSPNDKNKPLFPFPPPAGYQSIVLTRENFEDCKTLGDVDNSIVERINKLGYLQKSYYPHPYGYSMLTMIELIDEKGIPSKVDRFKANHGIVLTWKDWFVARKGYYRMFAFVLSTKEFAPGKAVTDPAITDAWPTSGDDYLPDKTMNSEYLNNFKCTLIIYEFKSEVPNSYVQMDDPPFAIDMESHLKGSSMLTYFPYYH